MGCSVFLYRLDLSLRVAIGAAIMTAIGVFPEIQSLFEFAYLSRDIAWGPVVVAITLRSTMGETIFIGLETIAGTAIPVLLFWIGERQFDGTVSLVIWTLFTTFLFAFFPCGDELRRWSVSNTITMIWMKLSGASMVRINGVAGLEMLTIATLAVLVCVFLSVVPFPRTARSAARDELTSLSESFVELLDPLSGAFCDPLKNGHFRKKVTSRTQRTFERLTHIEQHLADAWYEPACFDPLRRGRLIVLADHMRMCLRSLHILVNLRNQRAPHKSTTRFHNEWKGLEQAVNNVMRLLGDYACGRAVDDAALNVSIGSLRGAMTAWHFYRSQDTIDKPQSRNSGNETVDGSTPPGSTEPSTMLGDDGVILGQAAQTSASDHLVKDTFSFQMDYLYHIMERYIHTIGRPVAFVTTVVPGHATVTSPAVLEEVRASQPRELEDTDDTPTGVDMVDYVFKKYGFWASIPRTMPSVSLTKERLRDAAKTIFPVCSYGIFTVCFLVGGKSFGSAFSKSLNRFLGTVLACLAGYFPLYMFGPTPLCVLLVNTFVLFGFVFMRSSSKPSQAYIGKTAAWVLPLVTMGVAANGEMKLDSDPLWQRLMENFIAVLVALFYDYIVFGQRAEMLLRQKLARSLRISSRVISKIVKHYTIPCGHCQARASLECEGPFLELLELGSEQRQLVAAAEMEPTLWHPDYAKEGFMALCDTTEEIRLHAISLRRTLELASWTSTHSDCDHDTTLISNAYPVETQALLHDVAKTPALLHDVVKEMGAPLVQSMGYLDVSFKSLARSLVAPKKELPDDIAEVNEHLPDLFDSYSAILMRIDRKQALSTNQIMRSNAVMHTIVSLADATATLWQSLCSVADDEKHIAAIVAQQRKIRKALERHQRKIRADIKRQQEDQTARRGRKMWSKLSLPQRGDSRSPSLQPSSPSLQRAHSPQSQDRREKRRPWKPWSARKNTPTRSAGSSPVSRRGSLATIRSHRSGVDREELISKRLPDDPLLSPPPVHAYTEDPNFSAVRARLRHVSEGTDVDGDPVQPSLIDFFKKSWPDETLVSPRSEPPVRAFSDEPNSNTVRAAGLRKLTEGDEDPVQPSLLEIIVNTASLIEEAQDGDANATI